MKIRHADRRLERLETGADDGGRWDAAVVKAFRKRMQFLRAAPDERALYAMKSLHYEKRKGNRAHERSLRLNDQWRLIVQIEAAAERVLAVMAIEDYH